MIRFDSSQSEDSSVKGNRQQMQLKMLPCKFKSKKCMENEIVMKISEKPYFTKMFCILVLILFLPSQYVASWGDKWVNLTDPDLSGRYTITEEVSRDIEFDLYLETNLNLDESVIVRSEIMDLEEEEIRAPLYFIASHSGSMRSWQVMIMTRDII